MLRVLGVLVCASLLCSVAGAETVTVSDTLDYTDNGLWSSPYFYVPGEIVDHQPYHRGSMEDWNWTHDLLGSAPEGATGIQSATLSIKAWDVDSDEGENDLIYANGVMLGMLTGGVAEWSTTSFDLPEQVLDDLWQDGEVNIFMNIDSALGGFRVTLDHSLLAVSYITGGEVPEPATIGLLGLGAMVMLRRRKQSIVS